MTRSELRALREEVDRIDAEIVSLAARRRRVAREIGLVKSKDGIAVRDKKREAAVAEDMERRARKAGLSPGTGRAVAKALVSDGVSSQKERRPQPLAGRKALVVGGAGKMGEWTGRFLSCRGAEVSVWDPRGKLQGYPNVKRPEDEARKADMVVIASPLGVARDELRKIIDAGPRGLVFDLCSVKSHIAVDLRRAAGQGLKVTSVHPMFGPRAPSPEGLNVIVCGCGCAGADKAAAALFSGAGAKVSRLSLEEHDELMAYALALPHVTALLFGGTLRASRRGLPELASAGGTSFARLLSLAREVSGESRRVYHDIQSLNPNTRRALEAVERTLSELRDAALDGDPRAFGRIMDDERKYLEA